MSSADIMKMDLYAILEVREEATEKEIVKAYRKKALKCHPDKNPDNPAAVELFQQLSRALEILSDPAARAAFDKARKAKKAAAARHEVLDSKRKKFKEDLEARERAHDAQTATNAAATRNLQAEIERLRKEGSRLLEQEQELLREELRRERERRTADVDEEAEQQAPAARLKVKWKAAKDDPENGGYTEEVLRAAFEKFGEVTALVISKKRNGSAIIEFASGHNALLAVQHETGLPENPITISWLSGQPTDPPPASNSAHKQEEVRPKQAVPSAIPEYQPVTSQKRDFESLVLMRLRQAEERKKLIEQMQKEDAEDT